MIVGLLSLKIKSTQVLDAMELRDLMSRWMLRYTYLKSMLLAMAASLNVETQCCRKKEIDDCFESE